jgi:hypothetical protein
VAIVVQHFEADKVVEEKFVFIQGGELFSWQANVYPLDCKSLVHIVDTLQFKEGIAFVQASLLYLDRGV